MSTVSSRPLLNRYHSVHVLNQCFASVLYHPFLAPCFCSALIDMLKLPIAHPDTGKKKQTHCCRGMREALYYHEHSLDLICRMYSTMDCSTLASSFQLLELLGELVSVWTSETQIRFAACYSSDLYPEFLLNLVFGSDRDFHCTLRSCVFFL